VLQKSIMHYLNYARHKQPSSCIAAVQAMKSSMRRVVTEIDVCVAPSQVPELAARLRPAALAAYDEALKAVFAAGGERRRRRREALARAVEDAWQRLQLHSHGTQVQGRVTLTQIQTLTLTQTPALTQVLCADSLMTDQNPCYRALPVQLHQ